MNSISKKKRAMRHGIRKPCSLKIRRYTDRLIGINKYLALFLGATLLVKIGVTELNEIFLTVYLIVGSSKRMCRVFTVSLLLF